MQDEIIVVAREKETDQEGEKKKKKKQRCYVGCMEVSDKTAEPGEEADNFIGGELLQGNPVDAKELGELRRVLQQQVVEKEKSLLFAQKVISTKGQHALDYALFKKQRGSKDMECLITRKGVVHGPGIPRVVAEHFKNFFSKKDAPWVKVEHFLGNYDPPVLGALKALPLIAPITCEEIKGAIVSLPISKSPGSDGIAIEFYHVFKDIVAPMLQNVYNWGLKNSHLPNSFADSLLILIFKKGQRDDLANWRPIMLLNADYKILARILNTRLQKELYRKVLEEHFLEKVSSPGVLQEQSDVVIGNMVAPVSGVDGEFRVTQEPVCIDAVEGVDLTLTCTFRWNTKGFHKWWKQFQNGSKEEIKSTLDTNTSRSQTAQGNVTLSLRNVKTVDSGVYICEAGDGTGSGRGNGTNVTISSPGGDNQGITLIAAVSVMLTVLLILLVGVILVMKRYRAKPSPETQSTRSPDYPRASPSYREDAQGEGDITYAKLSFKQPASAPQSRNYNTVYAEVSKKKNQKNPQEMQIVYSDPKCL
nr:PREDICTED: uncharacterized protein LOC106703887 [Latimeria chalumnae]|eukprot:XP_014345151.1 PREDICTED: uncharacterized protein LOC106703887 [Latimeria chalumnae]